MTSRRAFPSTPIPTEEVGKGLPALHTPDIVGNRAAWLAQIAILRRSPGADTVLLDKLRKWIVEGVKTSFSTVAPTPMPLYNTKTFSNNLGVCMERLRVYTDLGALRKLSAPPPPGGHIQPLHAVIKPGKKARICVDLSQNFNSFVADQSFQMATVQSAVDMLLHEARPKYLVKLDLASCFLSFPIHPSDQQFFYCEAGGNFYQFVTLVFGRKDAPRIVSQLLDVVSSAMSDAGLNHIRYLDDFLLVGTTATRVWASAHSAAKILMNFGLSLSLPKVEGPSTRLEFLGIVIDTQKETLSISDTRQQELLSLLHSFSKRRRSSVRRLQSLVGKLTFAATVLPGARPFLRRIIDSMSGRSSGQMRLGPEFRSEIRYWRGHMARWNGRAKWLEVSSDPVVIGSDASTSGFAYGVERQPKTLILPPRFQPGVIRVGTWSASNGDAQRQQRSAAIQWGEFFCSLAAAVEMGNLLTNQQVVFVLDNNSDVAVINRQRTREPRLAMLLRALCDASLQHNFSFSAVHRSGESNTVMDWASRPAYHRFSSFPSSLSSPFPSSPPWGSQVKFYPPLPSPTSLIYINSRCLRFHEGNSASWRSTTDGW